MAAIVQELTARYSPDAGLKARRSFAPSALKAAGCSALLGTYAPNLSELDLPEDFSQFRRQR